MENITEVPLLRSTVASLQDSSTILFSWYDYAFLLGMLTISGGLGVYFGFFKNQNATAKEFLLGGNSMKVFPVAVSLVASHTSGITLLGVPADVYSFGATFVLAAISILIMALIIVVAFIPVFHELQLISTYEYLGLRFDRRTRKFSSFLYALSVFLYLPIVIYVPSLALSAATGINVHVLTPIICGICIFYTSIGGLKALVWIDTLQFTTTFGILTFLLGLSLHNFGGFSNLWNSAPVQQRVDIFDFSIDFTKRDSAMAIMVGFTIHWLSHNGVNQGCMQKFLSVPTLKKSKMVILLYCIGIASVKIVSVSLGLVLSATYADCDPFITNKIQRNDQLLPYFVLNVTKNIPGISGLFIAGVLAASLSTLSGYLNSVSGTVFEDFLKKPLGEYGKKNEGLILKVLVVIIGVISTLLVYMVENLGGVLSLGVGFGSVAHGPLLGMFILGMFFPRANAKGSFFGAMTAIMSMLVIVTGGNIYKLLKKIRNAHKPISVDKCDFFVNTTYTNEIINKTLTEEGSDIFPLFRISCYWFSFVGCLICVTSGLIISCLTEKNNPPVPKKFLSPVIHPFLSKNRKENEAMYKSVDEAKRQLSVTEEELVQQELKEKLRKLSYMSEKFDN